MRMMEQPEGQLNAILFWTWELNFSKEYPTISPPSQVNVSGSTVMPNSLWQFWT